MALRFPISPSSRRTLNENAALAWTFKKADNPAKARLLLDAARTLREGIGVENANRSYNDAYLYRVIPEIARRLDPGIEILPEEIQPESEEPLRERLMANLSNEDLALFAYQCHRFADYRGQFDRVLEKIGDIDAIHTPEVKAVANALEMLTCHGVHGNYAIHAMLSLDPEATQRGVKKVPGNFNGIDTEINLKSEPDTDADNPFVWCLVRAGYRRDSLIVESVDRQIVEDLYDIYLRAWSDPEAWKDPDRVITDREKEILGDVDDVKKRYGVFGRPDKGLPREGLDYLHPVAIQIEHVDLGVQKRFFVDHPAGHEPTAPDDRDEGPQP